jgi:hypothetical protein
MNVKTALETLGLPDALVACADESIGTPICTLQAPAEWYGFPPALIPIWSDGSWPIYIGYWKHWFVDRGEIGVRPRFAFKEFSWLLFGSLKRELSEEWCVVRRLFFLSLILVV